MSNHYDVIIVGAGPAGASLAARLARAGRQVLLVDQGSFPRGKVCGECVAASALEQLNALGLEQPVSQIAAQPGQVRIVAHGGQGVSLTLRPRSPESILTISRYQLDHMLVQRAAAHGADVLLEHRVRRVLFDADGVCGIEAGCSTAIQSHVRLGCRMLIAADGRHSQIVRQTGRVLRRGPQLAGFKAHLPASEVNVPTCAVEMHSFAGGYLGICPIENGSTNVCGLLPHSALRASRGSVPLALTARLAGRSDPDRVDRRLLERAEPWHTVANVQQQVAEPAMSGVLYVGDAQGTIEPLAGQGIAMALECAALAAQRLSSRSRIDRRLQQTYHADWQARYGGPIRQAARFGWLLRHPGILSALIALSPVPQRWKSIVAHQGYVATRLRPC